jgi:phospholipid/cholesterol/gamma-HCH transport system substrate-binding protein
MTMEKETRNNIKLGIFVLAGLIFLVLLLYMIGKNRNLFGNTYLLKARFENIQGLVKGNNVRFAGIETGTVKDVRIINDTTIEVSMYIENRMKNVIRKNAMVSIGTDGFVGNKLVNIIPSKEPAEFAVEGDILPAKKAVSTDEILNTLAKTNQDISVIAASLRITVERINNSSALWSLLNDNGIPADIKASLGRIRNATLKADQMMQDLHLVISDVKDGKGSVGTLLRDSSFARNLNDAVLKINTVGSEADSLGKELNRLTAGIRNDVNKGKGVANLILKDSAVSNKISSSLDNIERGTNGFNQIMEAMKHNFLFRGYFRKQEKKASRTE